MAVVSVLAPEYRSMPVNHSRVRAALAPPCPGPGTRREFLRAGALALGGLSLADLLRQRAAAGTPGQETAVILLYLHGGPSHLETYDLKPAAPTEYRSIFRPIPTTVPGMDLCELFPLQARLARRFALIRSMHHRMGQHSDGGIEVLTGKTPARIDPTSTSVGEHPDFGSITSKWRGPHPEGLPRYLAVPRRPYMTRPAYLGLAHGAFEVGDPSAPGFAPPNLRLAAGVDGQRLEDRRCLRDQLDRLRRGMDRHGNMEGSDKFRASAYQVLTSPRVAQAFDLGRESDRLRERYGRHLWGQSCLLARRLAEAGAGVLTVWLDSPKNSPEHSNWDDHILNNGRPGHFGQYLRRRLPYLDQSLSALIEDVYDRGLDRRILIVVLGEFGRTPRLSSNSQGVGRDHWPHAMTALVAGGGLRTGQVVGATNARGEYPTRRPYSPQDVLATIYRHLGIDRRHAFLDHSGRPVPILAEGKPLAELI